MHTAFEQSGYKMLVLFNRNPLISYLAECLEYYKKWNIPGEMPFDFLLMLIQGSVNRYNLLFLIIYFNFDI